MVRLVPIASNCKSNVFFGLWSALARAVWYFHSPSIHQRKSIQCPPSCQGFPFTKFRDYWAGFFQSLWKQLPIEVHDVFKLQGAQLMSQSFESNQIHLLVAQSCQGFASAAPELIRIVQSCADRIKMDQDGSSYVKFKSKAQLLRATSMGTMESSNPWHIKMGISHLSAAGIPEDTHPALVVVVVKANTLLGLAAKERTTEQMPAKVWGKERPACNANAPPATSNVRESRANSEWLKKWRHTGISCSVESSVAC